MSKIDRLLGELLFWFQVAITFVFVPTQLDKMATNVEGVLLTTFLFVDLFVIMNLVIAISAYRAKATRIAWRTLVIYVLGTILYTLFVIMFLLSTEQVWSRNDTISASIVAVGVTAITIYARKRGLSIASLDARKWLAVTFRVVPQLMVAWNIRETGGQGFNYYFMASFHLLVASRIWQIELSIKEMPSDKNRRNLQILEMVNWLSWTLATIAWAIY